MLIKTSQQKRTRFYLGRTRQQYQKSPLHVCDSHVAWSVHKGPSSEIPWHSAGFWETVTCWITSPSPDPGEGGWSYLNLMFHAMFKSMGGLSLLNEDGGGVDGEGGTWEVEGTGGERENCGQHIK